MRPPVQAVAFAAVLLARLAMGASTATLSATPAAAALQLGGTGRALTQIVKVADLTISTDSPGGCAVTVSTRALTNRDGETPIALEVLAVLDGAPAPIAADFSASSAGTHTFRIRSAGMQLFDIYIRFSSRRQQDPGTYSSSLIIHATDF